MRPTVPATGKQTTARSVYEVGRIRTRQSNSLDKTERTFSMLPVSLASRPLCLNHLSAAKDRSRNTVVMQQPAMKRSFSPWAPISSPARLRSRSGAGSKASDEAKR